MEILARAVGRRKEAVAQVQLLRGTGLFIINTKAAQEYLQNDACAILDVQAPFEIFKKNVSTAPLVNIVADQQAVAQNTMPESNLTQPVEQQNAEYGLTIDTIVKVKGGGLKGQAEAIRLGIARALCLLDTNASSNNAQIGSNASQKNNQQVVLTLGSAGNAYGSEGVAGPKVGLRKQLKDKGYLTQDSRVKERRKYGLKKARKASQYHKR
uniref:Small ribosomal subunit protein uS9c n=1 Tax=Chlamydomonas peterfii TaxID=28462 RepID=A0A0S2IC81_9CHLO|nr:ribosomal protein S9 [Chlamydomonas peterfii]